MKSPSKGNKIKFEKKIVIGFIKSPLILSVLLASILVLIGVYFTFFRTNDLSFFPNPSIVANFYDDKIDHGNSLILKKTDEEGTVGMEYILKEGFMFPYAGLELSHAQNKFFDVSMYNYVEVEISSENANDLTMFLVTKDRHVIDTLHKLALRRSSNDVIIPKSKQSAKLKLESFTTPNWWYSIIGQSKTDFSNPDFSKLMAVHFFPGVNPSLHQKYSFTITKIQFYRDNTVVMATMVLVYCGLVLILFSMYYFKYHKNSYSHPPIEIQYKSVSSEEKLVPHNDFFNYIHENFTDSELSLLQISKHTGINQRVISDTISEKYDCNLKTYINQIRINEAKRLLLGSDLNISEVGYKVGFNSPANFNRVFKSLTNMNPTEYVQNSVK